MKIISSDRARALSRACNAPATRCQAGAGRHRKWHHRKLLALGLLLAMCACGSASRQAAAPTSMSTEAPPTQPTPAQQEIASLWAEIEHQQTQVDANVTSEIDHTPEIEATSTDVATTGNTTEGADTDAVAPMSQIASDTDPERIGESISDPDSECPATSTSATDTCADICTLGNSICANARRICAIARELDGDAWAGRKCADSAAACGQATGHCCNCRSN